MAVPAADTNWDGIRLGFLAIDGFTQDSLEVWGACRKLRSVPTMDIHVVNGPKTRPVTSETVLDGAAIALAAEGIPKVEMYQYDELSALVFPLAEILKEAAVDPTNQIDALSTSVVYCEDSLDDDEIKLSEWLLSAMPASGTTVLAATGDHGSSGCYPANEDASVAYPASSPTVTAVGGTQFGNTPGVTTQETVWNKSYQGTRLAGGGGVSSHFSRPGYQSQTGLDESSRQLPDVSFLADPDAVGRVSVCNTTGDCQWEQVAGTSAASPALPGGLSAMFASSKSKTTDHRLGFVSPLLYHLAVSPAAAEVIHDVTKGDNDLFSVGCCTATEGYDLASGLGSFNFKELAKNVPANQPQ
jgi:subtilase family serine protease